MSLIDVDKAIERIKDRTSFLQNCHKQDGGKAYDTMMMYEVAQLVDDIIGILEEDVYLNITDVKRHVCNVDLEEDIEQL